MTVSLFGLHHEARGHRRRAERRDGAFALAVVGAYVRCELVEPKIAAGARLMRAAAGSLIGRELCPKSLKPPRRHTSQGQSGVHCIWATVTVTQRTVYYSPAYCGRMTTD
jgi:hypothetical protein